MLSTNVANWARRNLLATTMLAAVSAPALGQTGGDINYSRGDLVTADIPAIDITNSDGSVLVDVNSITTTGDFAFGAYVFARDDIDFNVNGDVDTSGDFAHGIFLDAGGNILLTVGGVVRTFGEESNPVYLTTTGGNIDAILAGGVTAFGDVEAGVLAVTQDGDIYIESGAINLFGAGVGLYAETFAENGNITLRTDGVSADEHPAIMARAAGTIDIIDTGNVFSFGDGGFGFRSLSRDLNARFNTIGTAGDGAPAILAQIMGGSANITANHVSTEGDNSFGIGVMAFSNDGGDSAPAKALSAETRESVTIDVDLLTTTGTRSHGLRGRVFGSDLDVTIDELSTLGDRSHGVVLEMEGRGILETTASFDIGTLETFGDSARGIDLTLGNVNLIFDAEEITQYGANSTGVRAELFGATGVFNIGEITGLEAGGTGFFGRVREFDGAPSAIEVTIDTIAMSGDGSRGVRVQAESGLATLNLGTVTTDGDDAEAVYVQARGGNILINAGDITTQGDRSHALSVVPNSGSAANEVIIDVDGDITTNGDGAHAIDVTATDLIGIAVDGTITTMGDGAYGIWARSQSGEILVDVNDVTTWGDGSTGILLTTEDGPITLRTGDVTTYGARAIAIDVNSFDGDITIETGAVSTLDGPGIRALGAAIDITATGNVSVAGDFADGVLADGSSVRLRLEDVTTEGDRATGVGVSVLADPAATGDAVDIMLGNIYTSGDYGIGLGVSQFGGSGYASVFNIETLGDDANGFDLLLQGGDFLLEAFEIFTIGDSANAVEVRAFDLGDTLANVDIRAPYIDAAGFDSRAVSIESQRGSVNLVGEVISTQGDGSEAIYVENTGGAISMDVTEVATFGEFSNAVEIHSNLVAPTDPMAALTREAITLNFGSILTEGENSTGLAMVLNHPAGNSPMPGTPLIDAGDINITIDRLETVGDYSNGVMIIDYLSDAHLTLNLGDVETAGDEAQAVSIQNGFGGVTLNHTGAITQSGAYGNAISIGSAGDLDITVNDITMSGEGQAVMVQHLPTLPLYLRSGLPTSTFSFNHTGTIEHSGPGGLGVYLNSHWADINATLNNIHTTGQNGIGAAVNSIGGDTNLNVTGQLLVEGDNSVGLIVGAGGFDATGFFEGTPPAPDDLIAWGHAEVVINGEVVNRSAITSSSDFPCDCVGDALVISSGTSTVVVAEGARLESTNGAAFRSLEASLPPIVQSEGSWDELVLRGTIVGDVIFGSGDDQMNIHRTADISGLGTVDGGADFDAVALFDRIGTFDISKFENFEAFDLNNSNVSIASDFSGDFISLRDSNLRLGNGVDLAGDITVFGNSMLSMWDSGASSATYTGDVFGALTISLVDDEPNDTGLITGDLISPTTIALDIGIADGAVTQGDSLVIDGTPIGDITLALNPVAGVAGSLDAPLLAITDPTGSISLANGDLRWGGRVFELEVTPGSATAAADKTITRAPAGATIASLSTTGFTSDGAGIIAAPAIIAGLDRTLLGDRASRRAHAGERSNGIWIRGIFDELDGTTGGVAHETEDNTIQLGVDLFSSTALSGSLFLTKGDSRADFSQASGATSRADIETTGLGGSLTWTATDREIYVDATALYTSRDLELTGLTHDIDVQTTQLALEAGTQLGLVQPFAQIVWGSSTFDGYVEQASGVTIRSGDVDSLRFRAGGRAAYALSQTWSVQASAALDYESEDGEIPLLPAGGVTAPELSGLGGDAGLRIVGETSGGWEVFGGVEARWAGGDEGADSVGARIGIAKRF